jgi:sugar phosphate permease
MPAATGTAGANAPLPLEPPSRAAGRKRRGWGASQYVLVLLLYSAYSASTFGMTSFDCTVAARQTDPGLLMDDIATGALLSVGTTAYVCGKAAWGPLSDRLGGMRTALLSLGGNTLGLLAVSMGRSPGALAGGWALARFSQAGGWSGVMLLANRFFLGNGLGTVIGVISTSSRSGAILGNLLLGPLLLTRSWRTVMRVAAVGVLSVACVLRGGLALVGGVRPSRRHPLPKGRGEGAAAAGTGTASPAPAAAAVGWGRFLRVLATSPRIWLCYAVNTTLTPVFQFATLLPLFLVQGCGLDQAAAARAATVYPLGSALSILLSTAAWERLRPAARLLYCPGCIGVAIAAMRALGRGGGSGGGATLTALLFAVRPTASHAVPRRRAVPCPTPTNLVALTHSLTLWLAGWLGVFSVPGDGR